ncbi:SPFH domain-containing protein [Kineosporia sp. A_224]|uniref:SPFH domain-containing protein n=1 Tax=Kineosporia sp. A_224 TaxID=1962180 RepID=UPI000B4AE9C9|nr:SPFH domain-containing protein [Kineosporia sp. A_224]
MADITRIPFLRHLSVPATSHVVHRRRGRVVHSGQGLAFWFRPLTSTVSEVPVDDRELPLLFHARTADFQDVTVLASVSYRFADPELVATRLDFGIETDLGTWRSDPLDQVSTLLTQLAQQHALDLLASMPLAEAMTGGVAAVRERVGAGLAADERLRDTGIATVGVRVVGVRPEPDVERALQTPARELVQQEADRATYERRAQAVERERTISENELQSRITLATQEEQLVAQEGTNAQRRATEAAAAARIEAQARADADRLASQARADGLRAVGAAEADAEQARMAAYAGAGQGVLLAVALRELAGSLPEIGSLTLSPDVLTGALARLAAVPAGPSSDTAADRGR